MESLWDVVFTILLGIHHPSSMVCQSAIADGSMPKQGGCVGVGKTNGLNGYGRGPTSNGVKISLGAASSWSYFTFKADNTDMSKSDIRILVKLIYIES